MSAFYTEIAPLVSAGAEQVSVVKANTTDQNSVVVKVLAMAVQGVSATAISIEADLTSFQPGIVIIGRPDVALGESSERVKSAIRNLGVTLPPRRITVNLTPADLPKQGSSFDLGIAVAVLAAAGLVEKDFTEGICFMGELGLGGELRPSVGVFLAALGAKEAGVKRIIVPVANVSEASLVEGIEVVGVQSLAECLKYISGNLNSSELEAVHSRNFDRAKTQEQSQGTLLESIIGQEDAKEALMVAAIGGHHMFMVGPPGAGKTMLATGLRSLLPKLSEQEALESAVIRSASGEQIQEMSFVSPFEAPHHKSSASSLIGGGVQKVIPGAISKAHGGILFLDEAPEFSRDVLDALRQPLETGEVRISRAKWSVTMPARFQLILAANPCPCGNFDVEGKVCECPSATRRKYLYRLSGPLMDRIDIQLNIPRVKTIVRDSLAENNDITTVEAKEKVAAAIERAQHRNLKIGVLRNSQIPAEWLHSMKLPSEAANLLDRALASAVISMRGFHRITRVAISPADLAGKDIPGVEEISRAMTWRRI
ncbi:MAG: YifB family Mg chelatase-like AAA ATPase [Microbacteriaceae bacterium]|nr:YifB family Mg chelatase-like AAA ATPase [Microbacteriaceae bacterium]